MDKEIVMTESQFKALAKLAGIPEEQVRILLESADEEFEFKKE